MLEKKNYFIIYLIPIFKLNIILLHNHIAHILSKLYDGFTITMEFISNFQVNFKYNTLI